MFIDTLITRLTKGLAANSTTNAFTAAMGLSTATKPAASASQALIDRTDKACSDMSTLRVYPFGGNDNDETVNVKVVGWNRIAERGSGLSEYQWVSSTVCIVNGTLSSTLVGLAGHPVVATDFFCDTLSLTSGTATLFQNTANVDNAFFTCEVGQYELVTIIPIVGTADDANILYGWE